MVMVWLEGGQGPCANPPPPTTRNRLTWTPPPQLTPPPLAPPKPPLQSPPPPLGGLRPTSTGGGRVQKQGDGPPVVLGDDGDVCALCCTKSNQDILWEGDSVKLWPNFECIWKGCVWGSPG